ncbi:unnamed protein product [Meganyctiphanes norvegica]|uniref:Uncharacterized protein n=1 Tax=Meganyctiphanes norvegica TaxID=48144 RepID=A0AAV2Q146_MEGNR
MASSGIRIKQERDEGGEIDAARGRFENALQDLLQRDIESDSENESDTDSKSKVFAKSSRPPRKRRRKETEMRDSGFHHTFVMRMFDRSVDLAQFDETSPLYPICRAWMINQPHNSSLNVKQEANSPSLEMFNSGDGGSSQDSIDGAEIVSDNGPPPNILKIPPPDPWPQDTETESRDPRIPTPLPHPVNRLSNINEYESTPPALLLTEHLNRWRDIRNLWKQTSKANDQRYWNSYSILKAMFDRAHEG